jgi:hypothetical protein
MMKSPFSYDQQASYRYQLEKGTAKTICPQCRKKDLKRYIDTTTGQALANDIGRCNRVDKCGYHKRPDKTESPYKFEPMRPQVIGELPNELLDYMKVNGQFAEIITNKFQTLPNAQAMISLFMRVTQVLESYRIGTYGKFTSIPFIDHMSQLRFVQLKMYDNNLHTIRGTTTALHTHSLVMSPNGPFAEAFRKYKEADVKVSCYFGAHRLTGNDNIVFVESPKTAVIGQILMDWFYPGLAKWVAAGAKDWINREKTLQMKDARKILIIPDSSLPHAETGQTAFANWVTARQKYIAPTCHNAKTMLFPIDDMCSDKERQRGFDIADIFWEKPIANTISLIDSFAHWLAE